MNMSNERASEHPLINSSEQNLFFPHVQGAIVKVRNGLFWWFSQMDIDSRQNSILKSPVIYHKLRSPAGNMLVQLATSRFSMALLVVLYISPEGHNWGVVAVK